MASCLHDDTHKSLPTVAQICSETAGGKPRVERPANLLEKPYEFLVQIQRHAQCCPDSVLVEFIWS